MLPEALLACHGLTTTALPAGAMSMGAGEYISVSSQRDTEAADVEKERVEQAKGPAARARELDELVQIYIERGLDFDLARKVCLFSMLICSLRVLSS